MQNIVKESLTRNGNGAGEINARGIPHRGWTPAQRVAAAADAVLGTIHVVPSIGQAAGAFYVSPAAIRAELKARAAADKAAAERPATSNTSVAITEVTSDVPTPPPSPSNDNSMSFAARCIVYAWVDAELADQVTAIRDIGTDEVWNALVAAVSNQ